MVASNQAGRSFFLSFMGGLSAVDIQPDHHCTTDCPVANLGPASNDDLAASAAMVRFQILPAASDAWSAILMRRTSMYVKPSSRFRFLLLKEGPIRSAMSSADGLHRKEGGTRNGCGFAWPLFDCSRPAAEETATAHRSISVNGAALHTPAACVTPSADCLTGVLAAECASGATAAAEGGAAAPPAKYSVISSAKLMTGAAAAECSSTAPAALDRLDAQRRPECLRRSDPDGLSIDIRMVRADGRWHTRPFGQVAIGRAAC